MAKSTSERTLSQYFVTFDFVMKLSSLEIDKEHILKEMVI